MIGFFVLTGRSDGPLHVMERHYLTVSDGRNSNHYRITVEAITAYSKTEFRQGWYSADAVDALFGEVSSEAGAAILQTENVLKAKINQALTELADEYVEVLKIDFREKDKG